MDIFEQLDFHPLVRDWFRAAFDRPSPAQLQGWPSISAGRHTLIMAPTGSGKTLAAFLWSIDQLLRISLQVDADRFGRNAAGIHTLYISPLKALNNDIHRNLRIPLQGIQQLAGRQKITVPPIRTAVRSGDTPAHVRQQMINKPPHILITTPESLYLLITSEKGRQLFHHLKYIIVDEIHAISSGKRGVHLSLTLERLMPLCVKTPQRIGLSATQKPLDRIAAYLGGQQYSTKADRFEQRPVEIVDCGRRREMDLRVVAPVRRFSDLPDDTVWPLVYRQLYDLVRQHRTTLIFANMRAQTEKIARELNRLHQNTTGDPAARIAMAHHGSISRQERYKVEEMLKKGQIPAVVATASLELGIDIGSIDLVVHLESPKTVSAGLQRVGRSGHLLSATSKGRIIPLYPADVDDALCLSRAMLQGDIEETQIPENVLDILAQQIVAESCQQSWPVADLYRLVRQSYCYRNLSLDLFENVLEMLAGKYADNPLHFLRARIVWDKMANRVSALRGSRLLAVTNGGAIADRGYFTVVLKDSKVRLGEVEEEFVNETRVGDTFFLGNSEWRMDEIQQDKVLVTPVAAINPRAPFWKGDLLYRDFSTSRKIGQLRREAVRQMDEPGFSGWLQQECRADQDIASIFREFMDKQRAATGTISDDRTIVAELSVDSGGQPVLIIHATLGARVTGLWAIALSAVLEKRYGIQAQYSFNDDGFLLRLPEVQELPPVKDWLSLPADVLEERIIEALADAPMFSVYFRYNASRALILPRSTAVKRIPLWLQRLRAADLLQAVRGYDDFPIIIETYRNLLHDVFDLKALKEVVSMLRREQIRIHFANTVLPSTMASALLFKFESTVLYEYDQSRRSAEGLPVSRRLLDDILERGQFSIRIKSAAIEQRERDWQYLLPEKRARSADELFMIIERTGPLTGEEIRQRIPADDPDWMAELAAAGRIAKINSGNRGWVSHSDRDIFENPDDKGRISLLKRFMACRGPFKPSQAGERLGFDADWLRIQLDRFVQDKLAVKGRLVEGSDEYYYCDRQNFSILYRIEITRRRNAVRAVAFKDFPEFMLRWQGITGRREIDLAGQYAGYLFPLWYIQRELLLSRCGMDWQCYQRAVQRFKNDIASGRLIIQLAGGPGPGGHLLRFFRRGSGRNFPDPAQPRDVTEELAQNDRRLYSFLKENGASYYQDFSLSAGLSENDLRQSLRNLCLAGLISCENFDALLALLRETNSPPDNRQNHAAYRQMVRPGWAEQRHRRPARSGIKQRLDTRMALQNGRWFLIHSLPVMGPEKTQEQVLAEQTGLLLQRYGLLIKEWYRHEQRLLPWYDIFQRLKRLEWQGEIRRGYFVSGLSGIQFALPAALEMLQKSGPDYPSKGEPAVLLSMIDPALPFGRAIRLNLRSVAGQEIAVSRYASNHLFFAENRPRIYCEQYAARLFLLEEFDEAHLKTFTTCLKNWLRLPDYLRPQKKISIGHIDGQEAAQSSQASKLLSLGFEKNGTCLELWPSAV